MSSLKTFIPKVGLLNLVTSIPTILGAALNPRANSPTARNLVPSLLQTCSAPPFQTTLISNAPTIFGFEFSTGVYQLIDFDGDGIPDLTCIQDSNTENGGFVQVNVASASSNFEDFTFVSSSIFGEETDGTWQLVKFPTSTTLDLAFIKTANTASGRVEIYVTSGDSRYETFTTEVATMFEEETDGTWSLFDWDLDGIPDLVFIKTSNTGTGTVEVHVASGASNFQSIIHQSGSAFTDETDGSWSLTGAGDLTFIKDANTATGTTEVYIATKESNYEIIDFAVGSLFSEATDGFWSLVDFNRDGILDLAFIKTSPPTVSEGIEVTIASGV